MEYRIDATHKILGRLATEVAVLLRGKNHANFVPNRAGSARVIVVNTDKIRVTGRKLTQKIYHRHSGYLGNLKSARLEEMMARDSRVVIREAVMGMLPKNRLRRQVIKHLILHKKQAA